MLPRILLFVGISSLCLASARAQVTYETYEFLPLAVGNSWVYKNSSHDEYGLLGLNDGDGSPREITISIERTEVIDGLTYYVFSSMPGPTPNPPHCITGKKVRWNGDHLMEHTGTGEISLYRFDTPGGGTYTIPETEGDTQVEFLELRTSSVFPPSKDLQVGYRIQWTGRLPGGIATEVPAQAAASWPATGWTVAWTSVPRRYDSRPPSVVWHAGNSSG